LARPDEFSAFGFIERQAGTRFGAIGMALEIDQAVSEGAGMPLAAFVSGDPPVGFAWLTLVDGQVHLEEIAVLPEEGRKGRGRALLEAACRWSADNRYPTMTLCTFAEVPWNGPFYRSAGFAELEPTRWSPGLAALRETERRNGLDELGRRLVMVRHLAPRAVPTGGT
jgi:GNAT superfamily N-acetyltransferase